MMQKSILLLTMLTLSFWPWNAHAQSSAEPQIRIEDHERFIDLNLLQVEGRGWKDTQAPYDRLPARAEGLVTPAVWSLSHHSAGLAARFVTDASLLKVRWSLLSSNLAMPHMPATGVSGVDLYVKMDSGNWRWVANGRPDRQENTATLFQGTEAKPREYMLYLPLYNGVSRVEIGVPMEAFITAAPHRPTGHERPLVFYGTSITQGGCASRPGMVHTAILGRKLDLPVINLGFSGNGKMEPSMADFLAELDPAIFILDCLPNMDGPMVTERIPPFVRRLRESHPKTPILLVEDRVYADAFFKKARAERNDENRRALRTVFKDLSLQGVPGIYFLPGQILLDENGEDTVDGSHPTDLGFAHQAEAFMKILGPILR